MHMQVALASRSTRRGDASAIWSRVASFASAVDANLDRWLADNHRIGLTELRALTLVSETSDKELRINDLAQRVGLNQSSATRLVSRLEMKGYVRRDLCQDDGRGVYAVITEQGEALLGNVRPPYEERIGELLSATSAHLPGFEVAQLKHALRDIEALLSA